MYTGICIDENFNGKISVGRRGFLFEDLESFRLNVHKINGVSKAVSILPCSIQQVFLLQLAMGKINEFR
jgi:hypothetical protein